MKPFWDFSGTRGGKEESAKTRKMQKLSKESENSCWHFPYHFLQGLAGGGGGGGGRTIFLEVKVLMGPQCSDGSREVEVLCVSQRQHGAGEDMLLEPDRLPFYPCKLWMK